MSPENDPGLLGKLIDWMWAVVLVLMGALHKQNTARLTELKDDIADKADREEVQKQGDLIQKVFDRMREIELVSVETKTQMLRIISHLESERVVRAETTRDIMTELRTLRARRVHDESNDE